MAVQFETSDEVKNYNIIFRQMCTNLILIAGILLALSTQLAGALSGQSTPVKVMAVIVVGLLNFSILFGILQHLIEAEFFRKLALTKMDVNEKSASNSLGGDKEVRAFLKGKREVIGKAARRWPTFVQMSLLGGAFILITAISIVIIY